MECSFTSKGYIKQVTGVLIFSIRPRNAMITRCYETQTDLSTVHPVHGTPAVITNYDITAISRLKVLPVGSFSSVAVLVIGHLGLDKSTSARAGSFCYGRTGHLSNASTCRFPEAFLFHVFALVYRHSSHGHHHSASRKQVFCVGTCNQRMVRR